MTGGFYFPQCQIKPPPECVTDLKHTKQAMLPPATRRELNATNSSLVIISWWVSCGRVKGPNGFLKQSSGQALGCISILYFELCLNYLCVMVFTPKKICLAKMSLTPSLSLTIPGYKNQVEQLDTRNLLLHESSFHVSLEAASVHIHIQFCNPHPPAPDFLMSSCSTNPNTIT